MNREHDRFNLTRFVAAQESVFSSAINELKSGRKIGHWMWFVFPQIKGLGFSQNSLLFAISSVDEALEYLDHPVLGSRLVQCTEALLRQQATDSRQIFGQIDSLKFCSCMTLFDLIQKSHLEFAMALEKFFLGKRDIRTIELCNTSGYSTKERFAEPSDATEQQWRSDFL